MQSITISITNKDLDNQLDFYRKMVENIPFKSKLKTKVLKIAALKEAIINFHNQESFDNEIGGWV